VVEEVILTTPLGRDEERCTPQFAPPNKQLELTARHLGGVRPGRPRCGRALGSSRAAKPRRCVVGSRAGGSSVVNRWTAP
jgi:hypothetical protein